MKNKNLRQHKIRKVIVLGSGALKIGEAGEFDYSGSQALKALREEGIKTVLINPNIATIQTSEGMADRIYFLPVTPFFVEKVIAREKPDGILLSFGGQTALNCGVELFNSGTFKKYGVKVLGTPVETIINTEDRALFVHELNKIDAKTPKSEAVNNVEDALKAAAMIGYPVMVRVAYALGGRGSGVARTKDQLFEMATKAFTYIKQILIEECLAGWKEVEYEVVRDCHDNCITVCNMENFDPLGIHTGESIVVAPSQTLTDSEYHKLREISIRVIRHLGIIGECNIQFALDPTSEDYRIIEVNARLSRSSALASKATGYPLAFVAAKLSLGHSIMELKNSITKITSTCFEPALDYIVVKIPRWDLEKFTKVSKQIGSEMKSVGEVMAIGRNFEETFQKAIRMLGQGMNGVVANNGRIRFDDVEHELKNPTDKRAFAVIQAIKQGISVDRIYELSRIDKWFIYKMQNIVEMEKKLKSNPKTRELLLEAKKIGFSDRQLSLIYNTSENHILDLRKKYNIHPFVKQIDTLAAEYPAKTNYLYLTYNAAEDDIDYSKANKNAVVVLGGGAYRIGSSVEFDWCCVNSVFALRKLGYGTIMINYNPETVSTDYDICDKLYFDELSFETVNEIYLKEQPYGMILSTGGQIPNNIAMKCHESGLNVLGTSPLSIDNAEDRHKFSKLLDELGIDQPEWKELTTVEEAKRFADKAGYPVLIRPSYVLSGAAMSVAFNHEDLAQFLKKATDVSSEHPVVISKFITNAKEIEIDAVADNGKIIIYAISEHIENAGVHSGDATMVFPPQLTYIETIRRIKKIAKDVASRLKITGPFNMQFIAKENHIKVIELNLRASRSFPFVSKVSKINFIDLATKAIMGKKPRGTFNTLDLDWVGVKAPQFSFSRLRGADPVLSVEMASTGEVATIGTTLNEAFLKSILSVGMELPKKDVLVSLGGDENKHKLLPTIKSLSSAGFNIFATKHTSEFLTSKNIPNKMVYKAHNSQKQDNIITLMQKKKLDFVINIPDDFDRSVTEDNYLIRRNAVDYSIPLLTNIQITKVFVDALLETKMDDLEIRAWNDYK
ncbi:carbamoyl-phosphate synthase (glutamine-hydrolyzing) large subunit [Candidatus Woesearchaeota archaeon]|nr:carbamoyl-phosphate synthase (glutamine-hydrolyzing) large subunit [Candidatus Woesearchaeota archaeon]